MIHGSCVYLGTKCSIGDLDLQLLTFCDLPGGTDAGAILRADHSVPALQHPGGVERGHPTSQVREPGFLENFQVAESHLPTPR